MLIENLNKNVMDTLSATIASVNRLEEQYSELKVQTHINQQKREYANRKQAPNGNLKFTNKRR